MALQPTTVYEEALPILKVGHIIRSGAGTKGGTGFYVVKEIRIGRYPVTNAAIRSTIYQLNVSNDTNFSAVSGDINVNRIVHLQYFCIMTSSSIALTPFWGKDPLMAKDVELSVTDSDIPQTSPLKLDKWSYDQSQYFGIKTASATSIVFEILMINYTVEPAPEYSDTKLPRKYLEITSAGNARFIEA